MAIDREGWHLLSPAVKGFLLDAGREGYVKLTSPVVSNLKYSESGRDAMRNIFVAEYQQLCDDVTEAIRTAEEPPAPPKEPLADLELLPPKLIERLAAAAGRGREL